MSVYKKEDIAYVDESGIYRYLYRRNVRSARGKKCLALWPGRNFIGRTLSPRTVSVYKKEDIAYVDESGIYRHLYRRNVRSARGKKVFGFVAGKKFRQMNIVAGYVNGETIAECVYNCYRMCL